MAYTQQDYFNQYNKGNKKAVLNQKPEDEGKPEPT